MKTVMNTVIVFFMGCLLTACVTRPDEHLVPTTVNKIDEAQAWQLTGRILVKTQNDKSSANLFWLHSSSRDEMKLNTMLGISVLSLNVGAKETTLDFGGKTYKDKNPQQLLKRLTGWSIPINHLPFWVTGQFSDDIKVIARTRDGRPSRLQTRDDVPWKIQIQSWQQIDNVELPKLIVLERFDLKFKIQINHWQALMPSLSAKVLPTESLTINQ